MRSFKALLWALPLGLLVLGCDEKKAEPTPEAKPSATAAATTSAAATASAAPSAAAPMDNTGAAGGCKPEPGAKCPKAKIGDAEWAGKDLTGADFEGADMESVNLAGAEPDEGQLQGREAG